MKLFWLLSVLVAVAASASITQTRVETDGTTDLSGWREKATVVIAKAIATMEIVISKLPVDTTITPVLFIVKDDLRKTLTDIQGTSVTGTLANVNQFTSLKKILWTLSEVLVRLPEGPLKNHVEQVIATIYQVTSTIESNNAITTSDSIWATGVNSYTALSGLNPTTMFSGLYPHTMFSGLYPHTMYSGVYPHTMNSGLYPNTMYSGMYPHTMYSGFYPEMMGSKLTGTVFTKLNWRVKATEMIEKTVAHMAFVTSKLTEGSTLKPVLINAMEFLNQKMTDLQDTTVTFTETDCFAMLHKIRETVEAVIVKLPERPLKKHLQEVVFGIRMLLSNVW